METQEDPTLRFSSRVDQYVAARPSYPFEIVDLLRSRCGMSTDSRVADVGAGTGIFTRLLVDGGFAVDAVEPNERMRTALSQNVEGAPRVKIYDGRAEATGLVDASVDMITCAQSYHWFDNAATLAEFHRISKRGAWAALVWNSRLHGGNAFHEGYEALLLTLPEYTKVRHRGSSQSAIEERLLSGVEHYRLVMRQHLDLEGLLARSFSSSYVPPRETDVGDTLASELEKLFEQTSESGRVTINYHCEVYLGKLRG